MKKIKVILFICLLFPILSGCGTNTITNKPRSYVFSANEEIICKDIDSGEDMGTLKIKDATILSETPFVIRTENGRDENSAPVYKETTYHQLIQIDYQFINKGGNVKKITSSNFSVYDCTGNLGKVNPDVSTKIISRQNMNSFLVALPEKSQTTKLKFRYNLLEFNETATIDLKTNNPSAAVTTAKVEIKQQTQIETQSTEKQTEKQDESQAQSSESQFQQNDNPIDYDIVFILLLIIIVFLIIIIIAFIILLKKQRN